MSLEESDKAAAAVAKAPRVTLADLEDKIQFKWFVTGEDAVMVYGDSHEFGILDNCRDDRMSFPDALSVLTLCIVVTTEGFTVVGKSAPASPENFDEDLGKKLAYEDVLKQLWPLEGYALRQRLAAG